MARKTGSFRGKVGQDSQRQKASGSQYGYMSLPKGVNIFKEEPGGRAELDFMPYEITDPNHPDRDAKNGVAMEGDLWYKRPFSVIRNVGPNNETVVSPTSVGKRCPITEWRKRRLSEGAPKEETDPLKPSKRNLYIVIPKGMKDFEETPHIWNISQAMFQDQLNEEVSENPDWEVFPDLEEGLTAKIRFTSKTISGSKPFAETSRIDFVERDAAYPESVLKKVPNLDEVLTILSYEELERKFLELDDEPVASEKEEVVDTPAPARQRKSAEVKPEPVPESKTAVTRRSRPKPDPEPDEVDEVDPNACVACEGSGKNSKGGTCRICRGKGSTASAEPKKDAESDRCPYGHRFGTNDCEQFDECDSCELWEECIDVKEGVA